MRSRYARRAQRCLVLSISLILTASGLVSCTRGQAADTSVLAGGTAAGPQPYRAQQPAIVQTPSTSGTGTSNADAKASQCVTPAYGKFQVASGSSGIEGTSGRVLRYSVQVQTGIGQSTAAFASAVESILGGPLGWTKSGTRRFQRVSSRTCDFVVELATAATSAKICASYGMDTQGEVSCRGGKEVVINLDRWLTADPDPAWDGHLDVYRDLVVNHEVGHFLGYHHMKCPSSGAPLPVMGTPFTMGLQGCVINGWPYAADGTFLDGPPQPGN